MIADTDKIKKLFHELSVVPPEYVVEHAEYIHLRKNSYLFEQGGPLNCIYYLCSGQIGIYNISINGATSRIVYITPGEIVGEMEILCGKNEVAFTAKAYESCEILKIRNQDFISWIKSDSAFMYQMTTGVAHKLYTAATAICQHVRNDAVGIVSLYIMESVKNQFSNKNIAVINHTRTDIADNCRISERTVNRSIKFLTELNLITVSHGKITVTREQYNQLTESNSIFFE
ncbi:MAG: Crp/Fnr family transcriptional regulator [Christensenella sp.]